MEQSVHNGIAKDLFQMLIKNPRLTTEQLKHHRNNMVNKQCPKTVSDTEDMLTKAGGPEE